jgi:hypothetical protein
MIRGRLTISSVLNLFSVRAIGLYTQHVAIHGILDKLIPSIDPYIARAKVAPFFECCSIYQRMHAKRRLGSAADFSKAKRMRGEM